MPRKYNARRYEAYDSSGELVMTGTARECAERFGGSCCSIVHAAAGGYAHHGYLFKLVDEERPAFKSNIKNDFWRDWDETVARIRRSCR